MEKELKFKTLEAGRLTTDKNTLERKLDKEHRDVLLYKQLLDDAKVPLTRLKMRSLALQTLTSRHQPSSSTRCR